MKNHNFFIEVLNAVAKQSTCIRLQVGAILVKEGRIISTGWNGVASNQIHCNERFKVFSVFGPEGCGYEYDNAFISNEDFLDVHAKFSDQNEIHAECNAICVAAKNGININNSIMYTSIAPCTNCAKMIIAAGIKIVYYLNEYDRNNDGIQLLKQNSIEVIKISND